MTDPRLTFFCLKHQSASNAPRGAADIICELGPHALSHNFRAEAWEYCCACQSFYARPAHEPAREKCPACERPIVARYLCDQCETMTSETSDPPRQRPFSLSSNFAPRPFCPCCESAPKSAPQRHDCDALKTSVTTARRRCPDCGAALRATPAQEVVVFSEKFYKRVDEYLQRMNGAAIQATPLTTHPHILTAQAEGPFWLTPHRDEQTYIIFPGAGQLNSGGDFAAYRQFFDCDNPGCGELWIEAPAVAAFDAELREWTLTQKGRLKVQIAALPPPPPMPSREATATPVNNTADTTFKGLSQYEQHSTPPLTTKAPAVVAGGDKRPLFIGAGIAMLALLAAVIFFAFPSAKRQIIGKAQHGQLFTPQGDSAYDLFQRNSFSSGDLAELRDSVAPQLKALGANALQRLYSDSSYNPSIAELEEFEKAYAWLNTLSPQSGYQARRFYFRGRIDYETQNYSSADKNFRQAMQQESTWALPVNTLARVFMRNKDYRSAETCYQQAIERDRNWMFPRINLCTLQVNNLKDFNQAIGTCQGVLQLEANKASGYYYLGRAYEGAGNGCAALEQYRRAIELAGGNTNPGFNVTKLQELVNTRAQRLCAN